MVVVWAEDEATDRRLIEEALGDSARLVRFVGDGAAALRAIDDRRPQAIVLDIHMPHLDGIATLRRIRAHEDLKHLPVVMFSNAQFLEGDCRALGVVDFVQKPVHHDQFVAAVQRVEQVVRSRLTY